MFKLILQHEQRQCCYQQLCSAGTGFAESIRSQTLFKAIIPSSSLNAGAWHIEFSAMASFSILEKLAIAENPLRHAPALKLELGIIASKWQATGAWRSVQRWHDRWQD